LIYFFEGNALLQWLGVWLLSLYEVDNPGKGKNKKTMNSINRGFFRLHKEYLWHEFPLIFWLAKLKRGE
jgi:hypothetical protein